MGSKSVYEMPDNDKVLSIIVEDKRQIACQFDALDI